MEKDRYEITSLLGKGRTGGVYTAEDTKLERTIAIRRFFSARGNTSLEGWKEQFTTIALNLCNLHEPSLLPIFDAGVDEDGAFLVSQIVKGTRLSEYLADKPLNQEEAYDLASQLLETLAVAHAAGFIHGAITSGSMHMVERGGGRYRFMLMDLGLARLAPLIQGKSSSLARMADLALLAPELFDGEKATPSTDCYMIGHLVYLSLIGGHPFALLNQEEVEKAHKEGELPPLTKYRSDLSPTFIQWISTLTERDKEQRVKDTTEALRTLPKRSELTASFKASKDATKRITPTKLAQPKHPTAKQPTTPPPSLTPIHQKSQKTKVFVIVGSIVAVLLVALVSLSSSGKKKSAPTEQITAEQRKALDKKFAAAEPKASDFIELRKTTDPTKHSRQGCEISDSTQLDWAVYRHPIVTHSLRSAQPQRIGTLIALGDIKASKIEQKSLLFYSKGGTTHHSDLTGLCARAKDGWQVPINIKNIPSDTATLKIHFTQRNVKTRVQLLVKSGNKNTILTSKRFRDSSPYASFGIASELNLKELAPHSQIIVQFTAVSPIKPNAQIALNAIILE